MMFDMGAVSEDGGSVGDIGSDPLRVVRAIMEPMESIESSAFSVKNE